MGELQGRNIDLPVIVGLAGPATPATLTKFALRCGIGNSMRALRGQIGRGGDLPPGLRLERGHPLPPGYGRPLPPGIARQLPDYPGYEWRRLGTDMVLVAVGTGLVYAILQGVLD